MNIAKNWTLTHVALAASSIMLLAGCGAGSGGGEPKPDLASVELCPTTGAGLRGTTEILHCKCDAMKVGTGVVFGSGPYLDDSSICRAAAHAGIVGEDGEGVVVSVTPVNPEGMEFLESTQNGVLAGEYISSNPAKGAYSLN